MQGTLRVFVALQCWGYAAAHLHFGAKSAISRVLEKEFYLSAGDTALVDQGAAICLALICAPAAYARSPATSDRPVGSWPVVPPEVIRRFDPPDTPYGSGHRGVDLGGQAGQQVRAALPGQVSFAGVIAGKGVVVVNHGETRTTYEPVAASLEVGATVAAGQVIGSLQLPGSHCFPRACLHWGWLRGEIYLDPLLLVGVRRVRLLPLTGGVSVLGPRMGLLIDPPQPFGRHMRVELSGGQGRMPQQLLHGSQIRPTL